MRHDLMFSQGLSQEERPSILKSALWILSLAVGMGVKSERLLAGQVLTRPQLSYCVSESCVGINGDIGFVGRDGQTYLFQRVRLDLRGVSWIFLKDKYAQRALVDFRQKQIKLYGVQISGREFDLLIDLDKLEITKVIDSR